jgi:hypothetical protein
VKARFSITASITPPGTYGNECHASHTGAIHFGGGVGEVIDRQAATRALAALDERWKTLRIEVESQLLAYVAEQERVRADVRASEPIAALYSSPTPVVPDDDDIPI